jgi:hypothetical protein
VPVCQEIWLITRRRLADLVARIMGAGDVMARHVPAFAICAGHPARVRRLRIAPSVIVRLIV